MKKRFFLAAIMSIGLLAGMSMNAAADNRGYRGVRHKVVNNCRPIVRHCRPPVAYRHSYPTRINYCAHHPGQRYRYHKPNYRRCR